MMHERGRVHNRCKTTVIRWRVHTEDMDTQVYAQGNNFAAIPRGWVPHTRQPCGSPMGSHSSTHTTQTMPPPPHLHKGGHEAQLDVVLVQEGVLVGGAQVHQPAHVHLHTKRGRGEVQGNSQHGWFDQSNMVREEVDTCTGPTCLF